ncbi:hypothetical protein ACUVNT_002941 [Yersinia enterocolitica]
MNNIEELKKVALGANLHGWTGFEDALNADGYSEAVSKFIGHCSPSEILALIAQLESAQGNIKELESKVNHYVAAEYAHKHFDQTAEIIKRADSAELELVKVKAELSAANEKLTGDQVPVAQIVISNNWPDVGRKVIDYYLEKIQHLPVGTELFTAPQKPVVLPEAYAVRAGHPINEGERSVMIPKHGGNWLSRLDVEHAIRVAGFTVEGNAEPVQFDPPAAK